MAGHDHYLKSELYRRLQTDPSLFDFLQDGSLDGIWYWDLERPENEWLSPRFWEVLGFDPRTKRHLASEWQDLIHPDDLRAALEAYERHRSDPRQPYDLHVRYRHRTGSTVWVRCRGLAIRNEDGEPVRMLGAHQDVTALKNAEATAQGYARELTQKAEELERIVHQRTAELEDSNEKLSRFAYVVSHDLKAPLRGIKACVSWLEEELGDDLSDEARQNIEFLRSRTDRLAALIDGVLRYSRVGRTKRQLEVVDTEALVREVISLLAPPPGVQVSFRGAFPPVRYDRIELTQVFQNLLSNAIRFLGRPDGCIEVESLEAPEGYRFAVTDNGPGIAPENHGQIFELFTTLQARDDYESTGVGLSLCKAIVERNEGQIGIISAKGEGSTFWVYRSRRRVRPHGLRTPRWEPESRPRSRRSRRSYAG